MIPFFWFLFGFIAGATSFYYLTLYYVKKMSAKRGKQLNELIENMKQEFSKLKTTAADASKTASDVKAKMAKVREITQQQIDLRSRAEGPQRNAMDGKYKNTLMREMKALDEEKYELLNSILKDGHDPVITTIDEDGATQELKLSQFLLDAGRLTEGGAAPIPTEDLPANARRVGKFVVYSKPDSDGGTSH